MRQPAVPIDPAKRHAPATTRNREPISRVLASILPAAAYVLEIAAGSGEHAVYFARMFSDRTWQPTDADSGNIASIAAHAAEAKLPNLCSPLLLDVCAWPASMLGGERVDAVVCINMLHIAPWLACEGLMAGAGRVLKAGGVLLLYGPFMLDGRHTAPSNVEFDQSLRAMDPRFGVRDVAHVIREAAASGLALMQQVPMPANNFCLVFVRLPQSS